MSDVALLLTRDLLFSSRVRGAANQAGITLDVVASEEVVVKRVSNEEVSVLVLDLANMPCDITTLMSQLPATDRPHTIAFGPHVDEEALSNARAAGCDEVLSRGEFNQRAAELIGRHFGRN